MKTVIASVATILAFSVLAFGLPATAQPPDKSVESKKDAQKACMGMMQGSGMTDEGRKAMREFMQSPKAPQAMNNMMEMMGGQGGTMGGSGSMGHGGMMGDRARGTK
jgi:hypothetical protein